MELRLNCEVLKVSIRWMDWREFRAMGGITWRTVVVVVVVVVGLCSGDR